MRSLEFLEFKQVKMKYLLEDQIIRVIVKINNIEGNINKKTAITSSRLSLMIMLNKSGTISKRMCLDQYN